MATQSTPNKLAVVIGVGPGIGASVAVKFAAHGYNVGLISRSLDKLTPVAEQIQKHGVKALSVPADAGNEQQLRQAFDKIHSELGHTSVLVYNAGGYIQGGVLDVKPEALTNALNIGTVGVLTAVQSVLPNMLKEKQGTILVTGATASLRGGAKFLGLAVPKAATRNLVQSIAREVQPQGVHVAHIIIDGQVGTPRQRQGQPDRPYDSFLHQDEIAEQYWNLHTQHKTVWTHELDLRPYVEKW